MLLIKQIKLSDRLSDNTDHLSSKLTELFKKSFSVLPKCLFNN